MNHAHWFTHDRRSAVTLRRQTYSARTCFSADRLMEKAGPIFTICSSNDASSATEVPLKFKIFTKIYLGLEILRNPLGLQKLYSSQIYA